MPVLAGFLLLTGVGIGVLASQTVAPAQTTADRTLGLAAQVVTQYPNGGVEEFYGPWPADQAEFREFTTSLVLSPEIDWLDPELLATVQYVPTSTGPCLLTWDETTDPPAKVHWFNQEIHPGDCPAQ